MRRWGWIIFCLLLLPFQGEAGVSRSVPPLDDPLLRNFLKSLADHLNTLECLTGDPNGSVLGRKGDLKCATFDGRNHICMNTSDGPDAGTEWDCAITEDCPGGSDTQVQFNDAGDCGGDAGFLYGKSVDHASLGPNAEINATLDPLSPFTIGYANQTLLLREAVTNLPASLGQTGYAYELEVTPNNSAGLEAPVSGGLFRLITTGTPSTGSGVDGNMTNLGLENIVNFTSTSPVVGSRVTGLDIQFDHDLTGTGAEYDTLYDGIRIGYNLNMPNITGGTILDLSQHNGIENEITYNFGSSRDVSGLTTMVDNVFLATGDFEGMTVLGENTQITLNDVLKGIEGRVLGNAISIRVNSDLFCEGGGCATGGTEVIGYQVDLDINGADTSGDGHRIRGLDGDVEWSGASGTMPEVTWLNSTVTLNGAGTTTTARNLLLTGPSVSAGVTTTALGIDIIAPVDSGTGAITNAYSLQLTTPTTASTENAGIRFANGIADIIEFEGNTANGFETRLSVTEPTADRTITLPDATGTTALQDSTQTNNVACWKTTTTLGYCSDAPSGSGTCTCN